MFRIRAKIIGSVGKLETNTSFMPNLQSEIEHVPTSDDNFYV